MIMSFEYLEAEALLKKHGITQHMEQVSVTDFISPDSKDCTEAFKTATAVAQALSIVFPGKGAAQVKVPAGTYYLRKEVVKLMEFEPYKSRGRLPCITDNAHETRRAIVSAAVEIGKVMK